MVLLRAVGDMPKSAAAARKLRNLATAIAASNSIKPDLLIILEIRIGNADLCALSVQSSVPISNDKERAHGFELERRALVTGSSANGEPPRMQRHTCGAPQSGRLARPRPKRGRRCRKHRLTRLYPRGRGRRLSNRRFGAAWLGRNLTPMGECQRE